MLASSSRFRAEQAKRRTSCPVPDCGKDFEFGLDETQIFEIPLALFERRHFYRSELEQFGT